MRLAFCGQCNFGGSERGQPAFAKQCNFGARGVGVGGVVRDQNRLHTLFAQPRLQPQNQRVAGSCRRARRRAHRAEAIAAGARARAPGPRAALLRRRDAADGGGRGRLRRPAPAFLQRGRAAGAIEAREAVGHIRGDAQVREERRLLRDKRSLAAAGLEKCAGIGVGECRRRARYVRGRAGRARRAGAAACFCLRRRGRRSRSIRKRSGIPLQMKAAAARIECELKHGGLRAGGRRRRWPREPRR